MGSAVDTAEQSTESTSEDSTTTETDDTTSGDAGDDTAGETTQTADGEGDKKGEGDDSDSTDDKSGESDGPPETYELTPPEGQQWNPAMLEVFETEARAAGLNNDAAQSMMTKLAESLQSQTQTIITKQHDDWRNELTAHEQLGGGKLNETLGYAAQFVRALGSPELVEILNRTGLGNNVHVVGAFARAAQVIGPDRLVAGTKTDGGPPADPAKVMFPSMK